MQGKISYEIMHGECLVARIDSRGNCQTVFGRKMTQRDAAMEAVRQIGLNQIAKIESEWFSGRAQEYEMLQRRLELLRENTKQ